MPARLVGLILLFRLHVSSTRRDRVPFAVCVAGNLRKAFDNALAVLFLGWPSFAYRPRFQSSFLQRSQSVVAPQPPSAITRFVGFAFFIVCNHYGCPWLTISNKSSPLSRSSSIVSLSIACISHAWYCCQFIVWPSIVYDGLCCFDRSIRSTSY